MPRTKKSKQANRPVASVDAFRALILQGNFVGAAEEMQLLLRSNKNGAHSLLLREIPACISESRFTCPDAVLELISLLAAGRDTNRLQLSLQVECVSDDFWKAEAACRLIRMKENLHAAFQKHQNRTQTCKYYHAKRKSRQLKCPYVFQRMVLRTLTASTDQVLQSHQDKAQALIEASFRCYGKRAVSPTPHFPVEPRNDGDSKNLAALHPG